VRDGHPKEKEMKNFRHEKRNGPGDECVSRLLGEPNGSQASSTACTTKFFVSSYNEQALRDFH
jgi:hypothetical protein